MPINNWLPWSTTPASPVIVVNDQVGLPPVRVSIDQPIDVTVDSINLQNVGWSTVSFSGEVPVGQTSTQVIATNTHRKYLYFINNSTNIIWLQYGSPAELNKGIKLNTGGVLSLFGFELFYGSINAVTQGTSVLLDVLEGE